jgi:hypothetical protein
LEDLRLDAELATRGLNAQQQRLCRRLLTQPVAEAAEEEGVHRGTMYRRIRPVREVFQDLGLAEYLD